MSAQPLLDLAPGIYHDIRVVHTTGAEIRRLAGVEDPDDTDTFFGFWDEGANTIYLNNEEACSLRKRHTFFHELAHHVLEEISLIPDEETKCNVLGAFFMKLVDCEKANV